MFVHKYQAGIIGKTKTESEKTVNLNEGDKITGRKKIWKGNRQ